MRKITLTAVFLSCLLFTTINCAQALTDKEQRAYYDFIDRVYVSRSDMSDDAFIDFVSSHGVSLIEFEGIVSRALENKPTAREWQIYNELWDEIERLPDYDDEAARESVSRKIANKYGLGLVELHEISFRCTDWDDDW